MKIGMIGQKRVPSREGGVEVVVEELSVRMAVLGPSVELYNRLEDYSKSNLKSLKKEYKGIRIYHVPTLKPSAVNAFLYSFLAALKAVFKRYDVIHFHAEGPSVMVLAAKIFHVPSVVTIHGLDWQRAKWNEFATRYLLLGEKIAAKYADEVIVLSRSMQRYFKDTYNRETHYIPNGITLKPEVPAKLITEKFGLTKDSYILYLGRLVPEKGIHYLIDAHKEIHTDKRLVIAGKIDNSDYARKICTSAGEDDRILMADFVDGRLLEELFSNTYLYVLPSDLEGMPMSLLEAMSFGARCLVSSIRENTETVRDYGDVFEQGNVAILREKIIAILEEEGNFESDAQVRFVKRNYSWDKVVEETLKVYESACGRRGKRDKV